MMNRTAERRPWDSLLTRLADGRWRVTGFSALAVLGASLAVQPLLDGGWWIPWTALTVTIIALTGGLVRSMHLHAPLQPLVEAAVLLVTLTFLFAREEARWGVLPGPAAITRLRDLAMQGREYADTTQAPAASDTGLLLLVVAGIGLVALAADTLAAGLDLPGMTLVPLAALFVAPWAINRGHAPGWTFVVVAAAWFGVLAATQRERTSLWSPHARPGSPGVGLLVATAVTGMALLAGGLASLRGPVLEISPGAGSGDRAVTVDALVSLRRSLVSNDTRPVITLATTATRPDYLRLSILELFDGEQWQPVGPNQTGPQPPPRADGSVPSVDQPPGVPVAEYQLDVGPLTGTTLPSPNGSYLSLNDWPVVWDQRTSLPLRADGDTVEGARISLVAAAQDLDADGLRAASTIPPRPEQVFGENLADPTPLTGPELPQLARDITAGSATPFDAAIALQRWFTTDGGFAYSTQIEGGSDEDALATFLEERVGYCEQFAATMALMARSVGIPARVVVGFTQGRLEGNQWVVRGTDAHAWPELWMGSAGWVRFEPTPGAPTTTTPSYTRATASEPTSSPSASASFSAPSTRPTKLPDDEATGASAANRAQGVPVLAIVLVVTGLLLLLPAAVRLVRRRRRLRSGDGEAAYREVVDTMVDLRLGSESSTPRSTLAGVSAVVAAGGGAESASVDEAMARILRAVEWQRYGSPGVAPRLPEPELTSAASPEGEQGAGVLLAERQAAGPSDPRPGALAGDMRVIRRALARRAGWVRRVVAVLAPLSVITGLAARGPGRGGSG
jgi:transglutaminase-like putative cysteine protease